METATICRLCMTDNITPVTILKLDDDSITLCDKLKTICDIRVNEQDPLPVTICSPCEDKLKQFYEFKVMCLHSNSVLNQYKRELSNRDNILNNLKKKLEVAYLTVKQEVKDNTNELARLDILPESHISNQNTNLSQQEANDKINKERDRILTDDLKINKCSDPLELIVEDYGPVNSENCINGNNQPDNANLNRANTTNASSSLKNESSNEATRLEYDDNSDIQNENDESESSEEDSDDSNIGETSTKKSSNDTDWVPDVGKYFCITCNKYYTGDASTHIVLNHSENKQTTNEDESSQFICTTENGTKSYKCLDCDKTYGFKSDILRHRIIHTDERPFQCQICGKAFKCHANLRMHLKSHSKVKPHKCNVCGKAFTLKSTLRNHSRIHTGEKPFSCEICGRAFTDNSSLRSHRLALHTENEPVQCEICLTTLKSSRTLKAHMKLHTRDPEEEIVREFSCEKCGRMFKTKDAVIKHAAVHIDDRPFSCEICHKTFKYSSSWRSHKKYHADKKIQCSLCGKKYYNNNSLKIHMRVHTGEKPYQCQICGKRFSDLSSHRTHRLVHTNIKDLSCEYCDTKFKYKTHMQSHIRRKHPDRKLKVNEPSETDATETNV